MNHYQVLGVPPDASPADIKDRPPEGGFYAGTISTW